ncbi:MAG: ribonuclease P protein component [Leptolyngbya sp. SIO4C1]|nr:ribonuclease P protein component [Leptolyngbya sp. SIO4C1]
MSLARQYRLRSPKAFTQVYRAGKRAGARCLAIKALKLPEQAQSGCSGSRFGISISRKVSKKAVVRNRIKRQIRAALRSLLPQVQAGWQVVISVRSAGAACQYDEFLRELEKLLAKLEVIDGRP